MRRCAVIGSPIAHSLSPVLHRAAYKWLGLDWVYERHEVKADEVGSFVARLGNQWRGLSVTMPCKKAILSLGTPDMTVSDLGVGNTVIFGGHPADPATTRIYNTDVSGIGVVLCEQDNRASYLVYGNGATARSVVYALSKMGVTRVQVRARNTDKTSPLIQDGARWGIDVISPEKRPDILISTVPAQAAAEWGTAGASVVFDVIYDPWPTPLMVQAANQGLTMLTGIDMLAAQAVGQVELMTGRTIDFSILKQAADEAMSAASNM